MIAVRAPPVVALRCPIYRLSIAFLSPARMPSRRKLPDRIVRPPVGLRG